MPCHHHTRLLHEYAGSSSNLSVKDLCGAYFVKQTETLVQYLLRWHTLSPSGLHVIIKHQLAVSKASVTCAVFGHRCPMLG